MSASPASSVSPPATAQAVKTHETRNRRERMRGAPVVNEHETPQIETAAESIRTSAGFARRAGAFVKREFDDIWPPTLFFIIGFNLILLTTNLILSNYGEEFSTYLVATVPHSWSAR